ncbi:MAG: glycoside hydrolase family 27 protein [Gordonia sp. (in: high G+C Gram-positive bacteria)]
MRRPVLRRRALAVALALLALVTGCSVTDSGSRIGGAGPAIPGLPATPPMGWNSWNTFGCGITEQIVRAQADALVASGLRDRGYTYVVVDDCWMAPHRDDAGRLRADPVRFPSGMAALADYVHARGLRFGLYGGATDQTCAQFVGTYPGAAGSGGHERTDATTFASWGVDFLKYDWCSLSNSHGQQVAAFTAMRDALRATGRPIVYSINPNSGVAGSVPGMVDDWGGVATMTRATNDITPAFTTDDGVFAYQGITNIADTVAPLTGRVGRGAFVDPDMLVVGVGAVSPAMARTQMSLWAMMAAPLIAGNDLTTMSAQTRAILGAPAVLAIDQDRSVRAGAPVDGNPAIWSRRTAPGVVVSLTNRTTTPQTLSVAVDDVGAADATAAVDAWTGTRHPITDGRLTVTVAAHDTALLSVR